VRPVGLVRATTRHLRETVAIYLVLVLVALAVPAAVVAAQRSPASRHPIGQAVVREPAGTTMPAHPSVRRSR